MALVLPVAERSGELSTSAIVIPGPGRWRVIVIDIPVAQYENPSLGFLLSLEQHDTAQWRAFVRWQFMGIPGGYVNRDGVLNPDPIMLIDLSRFEGKQVRATLSITGAMTFGVDVAQV